MNVSKTSNLKDFNKGDATQWAGAVDNDLSIIFLVLQGRVRFGSTGKTVNKGENILGQFVTYTSNATPNTQDTVPHNLGSVPVGYIVVSKDKAGDVYKSAAFTSMNMYLKCSAASTTVTMFLIQ